MIKCLGRLGDPSPFGEGFTFRRSKAACDWGLLVTGGREGASKEGGPLADTAATRDSPLMSARAFPVSAKAWGVMGWCGTRRAEQMRFLSSGIIFSARRRTWPPLCLPSSTQAAAMTEQKRRGGRKPQHLTFPRRDSSCHMLESPEVPGCRYSRFNTWLLRPRKSAGKIPRHLASCLPDESKT